STDDSRLEAAGFSAEIGSSPTPSSSLATEGDRDTAAALVDAARMSERAGPERRHGSGIHCSLRSGKWKLCGSTLLIACSMASCSRTISDSARLGIKVYNCTTIADRAQS